MSTEPIPDDAETLFHEEEAPEPKGDWRIEDWFAFAVFWALALVVFLQFFSRYVLNDSVAWTEEIARYLLMALGFTGSALAARRGAHIAIEILPDLLPGPLRRGLLLLVGLVSTGFFAALVVLCWQVAQVMQFQPMVVIDVPLAVVYWAILVGLAFTTLRYGIWVVRRFVHGDAAGTGAAGTGAAGTGAP